MSFTETIDEIEEYSETEEFAQVGSLNHAATQANLTFLLKRPATHSVFTDLSLAVNKADLSKFDLSLREEIKPDICVYSKRRINPAQDILRMSEMPLIAIEIVSPKQGLYEIVEKFKLYFELGVRSCWMLIPNNRTVTIYASIDTFQNFVNGDVHDAQFDLRVPLEDIFE